LRTPLLAVSYHQGVRVSKQDEVKSTSVIDMRSTLFDHQAWLRCTQ